MSKLLSTLLILLSLSAPLLSAQTTADAWSRGNQAFADGAALEAIAAYQEALVQGQSANLHYNLANAYAALEEWGYAILHFHKALALEPQHSDARTNLYLARQKAGIAPFSPGIWQRWAENLPLGLWIATASIAFWVLVAAWLLLRKRWRAPRVKWVLSILCCIALLVSIPALYGYHQAAQLGVVLVDSVGLRVAPTEQSPFSIELQAGTVATLRGKHHAFLLVELPSGEEGYLKANEFAPVWNHTKKRTR